jgi:transglutaminase-like putative cysteine protease
MFAHLLLSLMLLQSSQIPMPLDQNPMTLSEEMKQFLDRRVDRNLPQMERLQALVSAVFHSKELSFSYVPATRTAIETYQTRGGNCLSFTLLFISMARYVNLDALGIV